jgi:hypothetical protein
MGVPGCGLLAQQVEHEGQNLVLGSVFVVPTNSIIFLLPTTPRCGWRLFFLSKSIQSAKAL